MAMQGRGNAGSALVVLATLLLLQTGAQAKNHIVGGARTWTYPALADMGYYDTWSAQQTFLPGDTLTFTYTPAEHDTTIVTATEYASCAMSTGKKYTTGTDLVTLPKAGTYYYYCGVMGHCEMGMKMKVVVGAAVTPIAAPALAPVVAPAVAPVMAPAVAPVVAPAPMVAVPVPSPVPVLAPVPTPVPSPVPMASPVPLTAPVDAPTPVVVVPGPVAAPIAPEDSSASSVGIGFPVLAVLLISALFML